MQLIRLKSGEANRLAVFVQSQLDATTFELSIFDDPTGAFIEVKAVGSDGAEIEADGFHAKP